MGIYYATPIYKINYVASVHMVYYEMGYHYFIYLHATWSQWWLTVFSNCLVLNIVPMYMHSAIYSIRHS